MSEVKVETWENVGKGRVQVMKHDKRGGIRYELIRGGQKFTLTSEERQMNMDRAANDDLDVFKNGFLTPVRLLDDAEDYIEIASNPNLIGESDLRDMFGLQWKAFEAKVNDISNVLTLSRLAELAGEDGINVSVKQMQVINDRIAEVSPVSVSEATVEQIGHIRGERESAAKGVTPR